MARPTFGPRTAIWEVILDGRAVTIAYGSRGHACALEQGREALAAGRTAQVMRREFCPACGTADGVREVPRRGRLYPAKIKCIAHLPPEDLDELISS